MTVAGQVSVAAAPTDGAFRPLIDLPRIADWLEREAVWPEHIRSAVLRMRRLWVGRGTRVSFELMIDTLPRIGAQPLILQGGTGHSPPAGPVGRQVTVNDQRLGGLNLSSPQDGWWLCSSDCDGRLPALPDSLDPTRLSTGVIRGELTAWLRADDSCDRLSSELIAWRAGRRAVVRIRAGAPGSHAGVYIKLFRRAADPVRRKTHEQLGSYLDCCSGGRVRLPEVLDVRSDPAWVVTREIEAAHPLCSTPDDLAGAARTLVCLHRAPVALDTRHTPRAELQTVCRWSRALRNASDPAANRLRSAVRQLTSLLGRLDSSRLGPVHRDFYAAQLLRHEEGIWLTDLDTLACGHPEVDVATFAAHLVLDALIAGDSTTALAGVASGFVDEYRRLGGTIDARRLNFYLASALLRLGALHGARGRPAEVVDAMWSLAEDCL